jgi:hypothetical protein
VAGAVVFIVVVIRVAFAVLLFVAVLAFVVLPKIELVDPSPFQHVF